MLQRCRSVPQAATVHCDITLGCGQRCNRLVLNYSLMNQGTNFCLLTTAQTEANGDIKHSTKVNHTSFLSVLFILSQNLSLITLLPTQHTVNCHQRQDPYESCIGFLVHYAQTQKKLLSNHIKAAPIK